MGTGREEVAKESEWVGREEECEPREEWGDSGGGQFSKMSKKPTVSGTAGRERFEAVRRGHLGLTRSSS